MSLFEYIVATSLVTIAFVKLYDWVEWQLSLRQERGEADANGPE